MNAPSRLAMSGATSDAEQVFGKKELAVRALHAVMRRLQDAYPTKTEANIAARAGVSTRAVEYWNSKNRLNRRDMSAAAFIALLQDEDGHLVLETVMQSLPKRERPRWWLRHSNTARLAEIERMQAQQDEEIKQLRLTLLK